MANTPSFESFFNVTIRGLENIDKDVEKEYAKIEKQIPSVLEYVGSEMIVALQKHIKEDWEEPYSPLHYLRRTDDPSLGTPLGSDKNMFSTVSGSRLTFSYFPVSDHQNPWWRGRAEGDGLIEIIQGSLGYGWNTGQHTIPERPFWNNFIDEQMNEGIAMAIKKKFGENYDVEISPYDVQLNGSETI